MIIDWLLYAFLIFALAKILNNTIFKTKPASKTAACSLTIVIFLLNLAAWSIIRYHQQEAIQRIIYGFKWENQFLGIFINAVIFSILFYKTIFRENNKILPQKDDNGIAKPHTNAHEDDRNINIKHYQYQTSKTDKNRKKL